uniref:Reverse transcriptase domain-containing protein n=1 Tax=Ascaris lumbricoides TaxID=6252 RepID=A0A0M3IA98_ASCLU
MLKELEVRSAVVGLRLNTSKTKLMSNRELKSTIVVRGEKIESVNEFICLGRCVKMSEGTEADVRRWIKQGWKAFFKDKDFYCEKKVPMSLRRKFFEKSVMPTILYGSETWVTTKEVRKLLAVAERRMERIMTGIKLRQRKANECLRGVTEVKDWVTKAGMRKFRRAAKISALKKDDWVKRITEWTPRIGKRSRGRLAMSGCVGGIHSRCGSCSSGDGVRNTGTNGDGQASSASSGYDRGGCGCSCCCGSGCGSCLTDSSFDSSGCRGGGSGTGCGSCRAGSGGFVSSGCRGGGSGSGCRSCRAGGGGFGSSGCRGGSSGSGCGSCRAGSGGFGSSGRTNCGGGSSCDSIIRCGSGRGRSVRPPSDGMQLLEPCLQDG